MLAPALDPHLPEFISMMILPKATTAFCSPTCSLTTLSLAVVAVRTTKAQNKHRLIAHQTAGSQACATGEGVSAISCPHQSRRPDLP
jgi:hypothetical protein